MRDLLCWRSRLVQRHTANVLAIQNLFARDRGRSLNANEVKRLTAETASRLLSDLNQALAVQATLLAMRGEERVIGLLERNAKPRSGLRRSSVAFLGQLIYRLLSICPAGRRRPQDPCKAHGAES